ncbi:uncharacterized protein [Leptinotarsa decemlineata]|uniref:uncharacterized protein n=1 Tax=Leptinotarsa decemlineata TaxID=7539 RepID=UPI003D306C96
MSSTLSTTELRTMPRRPSSNLKTEDPQPRLVRAASIEKIKRFNSFICSQHYYILPAILSWLKSSQPNLQTSTESTILIFRSMIFNTFFYKMFFNSRTHDVFSKVKPEVIAKNIVSSVIANFHKKFSKCFESTFLLTISVYSACAVVMGQLIFSLYLIYSTYLPYGMVFLIVCMMTIKYICFKTMSYIIHKCDVRDE